MSLTHLNLWECVFSQIYKTLYAQVDVLVNREKMDTWHLTQNKLPKHNNNTTQQDGAARHR